MCLLRRLTTWRGVSGVYGACGGERIETRCGCDAANSTSSYLRLLLYVRGHDDYRLYEYSLCMVLCGPC